MAFFSYLNDQSDIRDIIIRDANRYKPLGVFSDKILRGKSEFTIAEREIIAAYVSGLNECNFCYNSHVAVAVEFGVEEKLLELLLEDIETAPVTEKFKAIFHYVKKLTLSPSKMVELDTKKVYEAGWSEQSLSDAIVVCALFNFYNRLLDGHGVKGSRLSYKEGATHLSKRGYGITWIGRIIYALGKKREIIRL